MMKRFDAHGQRLTDCCAAFATYGEVSLSNLDTALLRCCECGHLTTAGEGDGTEYLPGVTQEAWLAALLAT